MLLTALHHQRVPLDLARNSFMSAPADDYSFIAHGLSSTFMVLDIARGRKK